MDFFAENVIPYVLLYVPFETYLASSMLLLAPKAPLGLSVDVEPLPPATKTEPVILGNPADFAVPAVADPSTNLSIRFGSANVVLPSPVP